MVLSSEPRDWNGDKTEDIVVVKLRIQPKSRVGLVYGDLDIGRGISVEIPLEFLAVEND